MNLILAGILTGIWVGMFIAYLTQRNKFEKGDK